MTEHEINRADIFIQIKQKKLTQAEAAKQLNLCLRQVQRLYKQYKKHGLGALVSKKRGKPGNHRLPAITVVRVKELVTCDLYAGFRPTFMTEKLEERHGIRISKEKVRRLMIESEVWNAKKQKVPVAHQRRPRRARGGELVQIDGSPHAWFEARGESCALIVFIDDATGKAFGLFFPTETTAAYMITLKKYILKYGKPLALYSDKHGIFRINKPGCIKKENLTQFGRAVKELEIQLIYAHSPQAKGRVERVNRTLQERLVNELRLHGISTIEKGNRFLETSDFWDRFNEKFGCEPEIKTNAHRAISSKMNLNRILCEKHKRKLSKNFELQYDNIIYQLAFEKPSYNLIRASIDVLVQLDDSILFEYKGKVLPFKKYGEQIGNERVIDSKELNNVLQEPIKKAARKKPAWTHPWHQQGRAEAQMRRHYN